MIDYAETIRNMERIMAGSVVSLGGGYVGVSFDRTEDDGYLIALSDDDQWGMCYEHRGDDGQREWIDVPCGDGLRWPTADQVRALEPAARASGHRSRSAETFRENFPTDLLLTGN